MVGSPLPFAARQSAFKPPPLPISAVINGPMTQVVVTFDSEVFPNPFPNLANWTIRWANQFRTVSSGNAVGTTITFSIIPGAVDVGIDQVTFAPPPFDILDALTLIPVAAFTDFPLTM